MSDFQNLGKYQIEGVLGKGAMGVVYKAFDPNIARRVAIKTIHRNLLNTDMGREMLARFRTEAQAVGRLTHPNIVGIFEFDQDQGTPYFVMEYVEGKDLKTLVKDGRVLSVPDIVNIIDAVLQGLAYTHDLGIVHRDIKPANIFITDKGVVKIADFGIARLEDSEMTQVGTVLGTPSYMSPEQCIGSAVDARSDLFSVGVMLYELLTGQKPFRGEQSTVIMTNVINTDPESPSRLNKQVPAAFDAIIRKALAKNVNQRYSSAEAFREDLRKAAGGDRVAGAGKPKVVVAAVGGLLMLVLGAGGWWMTRPATDAALASVPAGQALGVSGTASANPGSNPGAVANAAPANALDAETAARVSQLLDVAKAHYMVGRLLSPQGSNAWEAYGMVLDLDPGNAAAQAGQQEARARFVKRAEILWKTGEKDEALQHLALARSLFPGADDTKALEALMAGG